ncbi:MAG TPA: exodeoxyribonuclease VII large subunit [Candidatus Saccharimonadales bacterium]|nr:exodeoxyribonuclease VII large subunit [Candidatus Saccharimonadales bacterium]
MEPPDTVELSVSDFVALFNQTLEFAYPAVTIIGELANFRVSRNKWIYFDLKDEFSTVKFFGSVYQLPGPLEEGMLLKVKGQPRLHNLYGFSINVATIQPTGEGSIKKAADLLKDKLQKEGIFDESRKRALVYPPERIGLVTSRQSAAYADFIKILNARWAGLEIELIDVQVQGEIAPSQIVSAINQFNTNPDPPEILVLIRGGGSAEDLMAFSTEEVTRAVASSRVPTIVAIGHEIDVSLSELAADQRASTPSNAAELIVPDKAVELSQLDGTRDDLYKQIRLLIETSRDNLESNSEMLKSMLEHRLKEARSYLVSSTSLLLAFNPEAILRRGYAIVRDSKMQVVKNANKISNGEALSIKLYGGELRASVTEIKERG